MLDHDATHPPRSTPRPRGRARRTGVALAAVLALATLGACSKGADVSVGAGAGTSSTVAPAAKTGAAGSAPATTIASAADRAAPEVAASCAAPANDLPLPVQVDGTEPGGMPTSSVASARPPVPPSPGAAPDLPEVTIMTQPAAVPGEKPMPAPDVTPSDDPGALVDPVPSDGAGSSGAEGANTATAVDGGPAPTGVTTETAVPTPPDATGPGGGVVVPECPDMVEPPHPTPGGPPVTCVDAPATTTPFDQGGGRIVCSSPASGSGSGSAPGSPGDPGGSVSSPPMTTIPGDPPIPGMPTRLTPDATHGALNGSTGGSPCPKTAETCVAMYELVPATIVVLPAGGGTPVTTVDSDGGFSVLLAPGSYTLQTKPEAGNRVCADQTVTITAGESTDTSIDCALQG